MRLKILNPGRLFVITAFAMIASVASYGQGIVPGNVEVTGHLGIVSGIGSHGSFGGSIGTPISDHVILSGDLSYIPMGGSSVSINGTSANSSAKAFNFNGNLQYQFKTALAITPYAGAGLGFLHSSFSSSSNLTGAAPFSLQSSSTDMYFNVGGGFRYYVNERWGFRPELMIFAGSNTYVRVAAGVFYKFGE
jgi:hypothetical protein